jgi:hypothetical protein
MVRSVLPLIMASDYLAFQRMIHDLHHKSYEEWADDHKKAVAYRKPRNGSQEIRISPAEFEWWLQENKQSAHMELLWVCAEDKAARGAIPHKRAKAS